MATKTKNTTKKTVKKTTKKVKPATSVFSYLRFGESYTSLLLGIIVVIIAIVMFLGFVPRRNVNQFNNPEITSLSNQTPKDFQNTLHTTVYPSRAEDNTPTPTSIPTSILVPTQAIKQTFNDVHNGNMGNVYTVRAGDNLWSIAERRYKSGYNWVDIARVNKLLNPGIVEVGQRLILPNVKPKDASDEPENPVLGSVSAQMQQEKIIGGKYVVKGGDDLWDIAVRAYGDGYQWVKIAKENKLANPDIIVTGMELTLPRK